MYIIEKYMVLIKKKFFHLEHGTSPPVSQYETHYVTAHKGPVTSAAFTPDG